ncbi:hypothetical protein PhaeoP70_03009 [Phaeobacter inhibens]|nr:hypothetical protein PhaeoP92_03010 [Phaeobacter inhibens]AUQ79665.1 hypothetical protein PhaeoP74_03011 [Phaeobacter inhibens]AUR16824.1 hypothetical protein PhaeoP70_03009 [Phaeobacter inhibens]
MANDRLCSDQLYQLSRMNQYALASNTATAPSAEICQEEATERSMIITSRTTAIMPIRMTALA